jgi:hypothetical protein
MGRVAAAIGGILVAMHIRICPKCHSTSVHRSRRRGFVERFLLPLIFKRPYRCDGCNSRYYAYAYGQRLHGASPSTTPKPGTGEEDGAAP